MPLNGNSSARQPRGWWLTALAIFVAVLVLAAFVHRDDSVPVRTAVVGQAAIRSLISTNGKIEPVNNFEAHAPVAASVRRVLVKEGDSVKSGQLLVVLDDADARAQSARAEAKLKSAQADLSASERG